MVQMTGSWQNVSRILVVKPSSLGDIIHVFPALTVLKNIFPDAEFDFLVNAQFASLLDHSPVTIRKKVIFERKKLGTLKGFLPESLKLVRALRREKYDIVIDFQGLMRSAFFSFLARPRYGVFGFATPRESLSTIFYRRKAQCTSIHAVDRNVELLNKLFGTNYHAPDCTIPVPEQGNFSFEPGYVLIFPGARWESKRYPSGFFADIAAASVRNGRRVILAGSPDEAALCNRVFEKAGSHPDITVLAGKTSLADLFTLAENAFCVVCNDSGPLHIASILNKRIYTFFGPTDPAKTGPWNSEARVYRSEIECSGCLKRVCPLKNAPCHELDRNQIIQDIFNQEIS